MKIIWTGTDSLFLVKFPKAQSLRKLPYIMALRIFAKLSDVFTQEHYVCGELVAKNIKKFGMKKKIVFFHDLIKYLDKYEKQDHDGFNILYYIPNLKRFNRWLYGYDEFSKIKEALIDYDINFIVVDGSLDMAEIYPIIDLYLRPHNHDGQPRIIDECINNEIPFIWFNQKPDVEYCIKEILRHYKFKKAHEI